MVTTVHFWELETKQNRANRTEQNETEQRTMPEKYKTRKKAINEKKGSAQMANITCEILEKIGILSESPTGWTKELRLVNWNNRGARYDLREWAPGDRQSSRGITLSLYEIKNLQEILMETEFPEPQDEDEEQDEGGMPVEAAGGANEGGARRKAS